VAWSECTDAAITFTAQRIVKIIKNPTLCQAKGSLAGRCLARALKQGACQKCLSCFLEGAGAVRPTWRVSGTKSSPAWFLLPCFRPWEQAPCWWFSASKLIRGTATGKTVEDMNL